MLSGLLCDILDFFLCIGSGSRITRLKLRNIDRGEVGNFIKCVCSAGKPICQYLARLISPLSVGSNFSKKNSAMFSESPTLNLCKKCHGLPQRFCHFPHSNRLRGFGSKLISGHRLTAYAYSISKLCLCKARCLSSFSEPLRNQKPPKCASLSGVREVDNIVSHRRYPAATSQCPLSATQGHLGQNRYPLWLARPTKSRAGYSSGWEISTSTVFSKYETARRNAQNLVSGARE